MGYIHCCGGLRKTRTFRLLPEADFVLCELDYMSKCPICGHSAIQLTRIDKQNNVSCVRRINQKAREFFSKLKNKILYEEKYYDYSTTAHGKFYLYYNEYGIKKRCYSNLRNLKLGKRSLI